MKDKSISVPIEAKTTIMVGEKYFFSGSTLELEKDEAERLVKEGCAICLDQAVSKKRGGNRKNVADTSNQDNGDRIDDTPEH